MMSFKKIGQGEYYTHTGSVAAKADKRDSRKINKPFRAKSTIMICASVRLAMTFSTQGEFGSSGVLNESRACDIGASREEMAYSQQVGYLETQLA